MQHIAHIGADNVEALLLAAKDDPKLLPSFLLPEGSVAKEEGDSGKASLKGDSFFINRSPQPKAYNSIPYLIFS